MKIILVLLVLLIIFVTLWVDFRWRQWMKARGEHRDEANRRSVK